MKRFVVVEAGPVPRDLICPAAPAVLRARCADTSFGVGLGRMGLSLVVGPPPRADDVHVVIDEHLAVDVDLCRDSRLLDCADVLQGSRAHSAADALRRLRHLTSVHPACGIAAVPLAEAGTGTGADADAGAGAGAGGWAVAGGPDRAVVLVPYGPYAAPGERSLLPSCMHAWLVAGCSLREWPHAREAPSG
ncbi:hypothetical protein [Streptomyces sp. NBC_01506]|uniref:hypothetical protein n=1 Tax=Streptomyces sp. NBC_01506 TaxID=2903887 RepID=UPI00386A4E31